MYCQARSYPYATDQLFDVLFDLPLEDGAALQLLLGYLDDQPVATYSVFLDKEIAGFYSLTTLPEFRGQGLGTAISIAAADLAVDHGYESVMLLSEPMSRNLCKRMGFVETLANMGILRMYAS
ncbi:MAG: GNAT family N-acetyltransferase [Bacteroidota bacterium]